MSLVGDLREMKCGDVGADDAMLDAYSHDASIFSVRPEVVVAPHTVADIKKIVNYASDHAGVSITPRAAGTDMSGGAIGPSIVLDLLSHLNKLIDITRGGEFGGTATVQPGMFYRDFEQATLARGLQFPAFPASRDVCAMGGIVGNNAAGERTLTFGQTVDWIRSVKMVCANGNEYEFGPMSRAEVDAKAAHQTFEGSLYRGVRDLIAANHDLIEQHRPQVSKNSSGYYLWKLWKDDEFNMARLIVGSQGTLGVITEATLGLVKPAPERRTVVVFLNSLDRVAQVTNQLLHYQPESLESFDDKTLSFTLRFLPDFIRILGASNIVSLAWQFLPEAFMMLTGGLPKLVLLAEFAGEDAEDVAHRAQRALDVMRLSGLKARLTRNVQESHKYWTIRRQSFNVIRSHAKGKRTTPFVDDIIVRPEDMPEFLPKLYAILDPYELTLTVAGHVGNGNFHIIPLMDLADERNRRIIPEIAAKVYDLVLEYHGSITAEHNDGIIRGPWMERMWGKEMMGLFASVKKLFDPKGIFNPGKKLNVDWDWALAHIRKD